jgi:hypothetical protein
MSSDDPFACFGEESDSEPDQESPPILDDLEERKKILMQRANERLSQLTISNISESHTHDGGEDVPKLSPSCYKDLPAPVILPFSTALYMGPMRIVESTDVGGNRGYIATQDLEPGTLLLVESPIFAWPEEQIGKELGLVSVQALLRHDGAMDLLKDVQQLYPTKEKVDSIFRNKRHDSSVEYLNTTEKIQIMDMVKLMEMQWKGSKEMEATLALAKHCESSMDEIDIYRILLVMRYNGFGSGIYLHFSMFNHDLDANCIKFQPDGTSGSDTTDRYSEVRTTKFVKRGQPLTLDYLDPREQSHATRRRYLWDQHRFDIGSEECIEDLQLRQMYLVHGAFPPSSIESMDFHAQTHHVESVLKELEEQLTEAKSSWSLMSSRYRHQAVQDITKLFEHASILGEASLECISAAEEKLGNPCHVLLIRCYQLYLNSAEIILQIGFKLGPMHFGSILTPDDAHTIMANFVMTCHKLLQLQLRFLGNNHPDIARTNYDLANMINSMISQCPKVLYDTNIEEYSSFGKCQVMEAKYMREFRRIDALYPKDTKLRIGEYQNLLHSM